MLQLVPGSHCVYAGKIEGFDCCRLNRARISESGEGTISRTDGICDDQSESLGGRVVFSAFTGDGCGDGTWTVDLKAEPGEDCASEITLWLRVL